VAERASRRTPEEPSRRRATDEAEEPSDERLYSSVPLETEDGEVVIRQMNVGPDNMEGGGEWPDPETPPRPPAPGAE
jgi:hypothetical protein